MNYAQALSKFNSRARGRDYKVFGPSSDWARLTMDPMDGSILLSVGEWDYVEKKHSRRVIASIDKDDIATLHSNIKPCAETLRVCDFLNCHYFVRRTAAVASHVRLAAEYFIKRQAKGDRNVILTKSHAALAGTQFKMSKWGGIESAVIKAEPPRRTINRTSSKRFDRVFTPAAKYAATMLRMGALDGDSNNSRGSARYAFEKQVEERYKLHDFDLDNVVLPGWLRHNIEAALKEPNVSEDTLRCHAGALVRRGFPKSVLTVPPDNEEVPAELVTALGDLLLYKWLRTTSASFYEVPMSALSQQAYDSIKRSVRRKWLVAAGAVKETTMEVMAPPLPQVQQQDEHKLAA